MDDPVRRVFSCQRPLCPRCKVKTSVFRIQPQANGFEVWSFECPVCSRVVTESTSELAGAAR
jgi:transposase-like protein